MFEEDFESSVTHTAHGYVLPLDVYFQQKPVDVLHKSVDVAVVCCLYVVLYALTLQHDVCST